MKRFSAEDIQNILNNLEEKYPNAHCELNYSSPFELLVATILSAQCTDKRVNEVTSELFKKYNKPQDFAIMPQEKLEGLIRSCGFYRNKATNIIACSNSIINDFGGIVPNTMEDLVKLAGVGRKTANVVLSEAFKIPAIAVDTHVMRVSNRIGFIKSDDPHKVEEKLRKIIPRDKWSRAHHLFIFLGRYTCHSRKPDCENCKIQSYCEAWKKKCF